MILVVEPKINGVMVKKVNTKKNFKQSLLGQISLEDLRNEKALLSKIKKLQSKGNIKIIVFKILFGMRFFKSIVKINRAFLKEFKKTTLDFPFHTPLAQTIMSGFYDVFKDVKMFAFSETAFFNKLPDEEKYYAISMNVSRDNGFQRTGFHGIYHEFNGQQFFPEEKVVSMVLDKKTTVSAICNKKPLSISLGYTPLEGIMGDTSCGDIDSGMIFYLMKNHGQNIFQIDHLLKKESGFKGMTGYDLEMTDLIKFYGKDPKVTLAFDVYKNQIIKYVGDAIAVLGGVNNIIISGGYAHILIPIIVNILKEISFIGIHLRALPWKVKEGLSLITTKDSEVNVLFNGFSLTQIMAKQIVQKCRLDKINPR